MQLRRRRRPLMDGRRQRGDLRATRRRAQGRDRLLDLRALRAEVGIAAAVDRGIAEGRMTVPAQTLGDVVPELGRALAPGGVRRGRSVAVRAMYEEGERPGQAH